MIINIHGFGGEGDNSKYKWLCENFPRHAIYSPTFEYGWESPRSILDHLVYKMHAYWRENPDGQMGTYVVGNSLGGFFARSVNQTYPEVPAILINPSLVPFLTLRDRIPEDLCHQYLKQLSGTAYSDEPEYGNHNCLHVIVGDADERIDHGRMTRPMLPSYFKNLHVIKGGTHQLEMTPEVEAVFKSVIQSPEGHMDGDGEPRHIHYGGKRKLP